MPLPPPVHELEFIRLSQNHREFLRKLSDLTVEAPEILGYAEYVSRGWFKLAEMHLREARTLLRARCRRATFSRAYYAAYNASKAVRYLSNGFVSLKGDDHGRASTELPKDFPNLAHWAQQITTLYENRLRADYDNWTTTRTDFSIAPAKAIDLAGGFVKEARTYLRSKHGLTL